jgi:colanic acid/amylovoran biosynthesis protein
MIDDKLTDKPMRIGVLGATFETPNMGVGALAAGAVQRLLGRFPKATTFFLDYARESTIRPVRIENRTVLVPLVNMRFSKKFYLPNNIVVLLLSAIILKFIPFAGIRHWLIQKNECLHTIYQTDLFASVSGGDSFSDIYGVSRFLYVAFPQLLIILLGKPLVLLPQTYGPFQRRSVKLIARYIVSRAERAYCRDFRSLNHLMGTRRDAIERSRRAFCYDMAFGIDAVAPTDIAIAGLTLREREDHALVGVNVSGLLALGGYTRKNAFALRSDYRQLMIDLIEHLIHRNRCAVLLIPHVFGAEPGTESDVLVSEEIFEKLKNKYPDRLGMLRGTYDQNEIKYVIGLCDFFIGSRMHACIAAVSQQIPAVAIAYSDKFLGVMETIGVGSLIADARKLNPDEILAAVDLAFDDKGIIARELQRRMPAIRKRVGQLLSPAELEPTYRWPGKWLDVEEVSAR